MDVQGANKGFFFHFHLFEMLEMKKKSLLAPRTFQNVTSLVAWWSEFLTTNHEVPGSIPGSTMCVFP